MKIRPEACACTTCIHNASNIEFNAPACGDYDYFDIAWTDDNGYNQLYGDGGSGGEDEGQTACNPSSQPEVDPPTASPVYICRNEGPPDTPDWECKTVSLSVQNPPNPSMQIDDCGDLSWEYYNTTDTAQGGSGNGNCANIGCTTTDEFFVTTAGEEQGVQGFCCWTDCGGLAASTASGVPLRSRIRIAARLLAEML